MEMTVAKLKKNSTAELWVCLREYQGKQYVDVREHFLLSDDRKWHPTKKGIMIATALLSQIVDGLETLSKTANLGTIASIRKSSRDEIQVGIREFESNQYGEIRVWYWAEGGEKKPSSKGITFKLDLTNGLAEALQIAGDRLAAGNN